MSRNRSPFHALGIKSASKGMLQNAIDGAWNSTVKPLGVAASQGLRATQDVLGGAATMASNAVAIPKALVAGGGGAMRAAGGEGGLGSVAQGGLDAAYNSMWDSAQKNKEGFNTLTDGLRAGHASFPGLVLTAAGAPVNAVTGALMGADGLAQRGAPTGLFGVNPNFTPSPAAPAASSIVAAPAAPAAPVVPDAPAAPAVPTAEQLAQFKSGTTTGFNPNSWLDRNKMDALMSGRGNWADNAAARSIGNGQNYAWHGAMKKSAFKLLEKDAGASDMIGKGLGWLGSKIKGNLPKSSPKAKIRKSLSGAKNYLGSSPRLAKTLDYGVPTAGGGAALLTSNRMGHSSGRKSGIEEGYDMGLDNGMSAAEAAAYQDPGLLGRIMDVFAGGGRRSTDLVALRRHLDNQRDSIIQSIIKQRA